jgi:hypothetical protein
MSSILAASGGTSSQEPMKLLVSWPMWRLSSFSVWTTTLASESQMLMEGNFYLMLVTSQSHEFRQHEYSSIFL